MQGSRHPAKSPHCFVYCRTSFNCNYNFLNLNFFLYIFVLFTSTRASTSLLMSSSNHLSAADGERLFLPPNGEEGVPEEAFLDEQGLAGQMSEFLAPPPVRRKLTIRYGSSLKLISAASELLSNEFKQDPEEGWAERPLLFVIVELDSVPACAARVQVDFPGVVAGADMLMQAENALRDGRGDDVFGAEGEAKRRRNSFSPFGRTSTRHDDETKMTGTQDLDHVVGATGATSSVGAASASASGSRSGPGGGADREPGRGSSASSSAIKISDKMLDNTAGPTSTTSTSPSAPQRRIIVEYMHTLDAYQKLGLGSRLVTFLMSVADMEQADFLLVSTEEAQSFWNARKGLVLEQSLALNRKYNTYNDTLLLKLRSNRFGAPVSQAVSDEMKAFLEQQRLNAEEEEEEADDSGDGDEEEEEEDEDGEDANNGPPEEEDEQLQLALAMSLQEGRDGNAEGRTINPPPRHPGGVLVEQHQQPQQDNTDDELAEAIRRSLESQ
ncbi:unnamed protein product [Amoebophrya sp. A120]|nr:unnamed protein product [Amoebophrya sp. A120]|eukprot:GSA120T00006163001.1